MTEGKSSMDTAQVKPAKSDVKRKVKRDKPYGGRRQALTKDELDRLFAALKRNRHGHRDYMVALVPARSVVGHCAQITLTAQF
jgi:hypothetical protein